MKKLLLSIITMMVSVVLVNATDVKFDFATDTYGLTRYSNSEKNPPYIDNGTKCTNGDVTITLFKADGKNGMRLWTDGLRFYQKSDAGLEISVPAGQTISKLYLHTIAVLYLLLPMVTPALMTTVLGPVTPNQ